MSGARHRRASRLAGLTLLPLLLGLVLTGCGSDYAPPQLPTTGRPASLLGQVVDLEVQLPNLLAEGAIQRGLDLELQLHIEGRGDGEFDATVVPGYARFDMQRIEVDILSTPTTRVVASGTSWRTGTIGPLRLRGTNTVFEVVLDGTRDGTGAFVSGRSWESQSGVFGAFSGWRRQRFLLTATDFFSGGRVIEVAWVKDRQVIVRRDLELVSSDPALRRTARAIFVLNRLGFDNLQRLDPDAGFATSWQAGTGVGSNPHDALWWNADRALVSRYEPPFNDVAVVSPRGGTVLASIPLESLAENPDGTPRPDRMVAAEGVVFVGLQDIDRTFTRYGEGKLAVIDPDAGTVVGVVPLGGKNPGAMEVVKAADGRERIYVALAGIFPGLLPQELSGGVVVVNAFQRAVERVALDDDDAGGNIGAFALFDERLGYAVVSDANFRNRIVAFDPGTATVLREVLSTDEFVPDLEVSGGGILAVPDRSFANPGLCLYRAAVPPAAETPLGCASLNLFPFSVEALD